MTWSPHPRLLGGVAAVTALAAGAVAWPALGFATLAAALGLAGLAGLDAWHLARRPPPQLERSLPERAFQGRATELWLAVRNLSREPIRVEVFEELPRDLAAEDPHFPDLQIAPGARAELRARVVPRVRGDRPLGRPVLLERSPLGLWRRRVRGAAGPPLRVYPDTSRLLRSAALDPKRLLAALGARPARRRGEGMEFESLRDYVPGDDPRRLDWAASARRGRPVVRLHQHERHHTVLLALDASRLMAGRSEGRTKLDFGIDAALALAYAALLAGDRVGMALFDRELQGFVSPRRSRRDLGEFVELLRPAQPRIVEADFRALAVALAARQPQRALLVVFTDFAEVDSSAFAAPLAALGRRHRVLLVALRDPAFREIGAGGAAAARAPLALYRRLVLDDLLRAREATLARLRREGLHTLDLPPESLTGAVLNRYLELRQVS